MATDVGCTFDDVASVKSNAAFSDGQVGLPYDLVFQLGLSLCLFVCVCVCVYIKLHTTAHSVTVILVIICNSH